jgi:hypothetical protein
MERQTITLIYAGRRVGSTGKAVFAWRFGDRELRYDKLKGTAIGGTYTVEAEIEPAVELPGVTVYPATLRYCGDQVDDVDQVALWQAADQDARIDLARAAGERRHAKSTELDAALAPLLELVRKARTRGEVYALEKVVEARIEQAWWKR